MSERSQALQAFQEAQSLLLRANRIVILSHKNPDADSVGANLALREALENIGKSVVSACIDPVPDNCLFLKNAGEYVRDFSPSDFDLVVTVDLGSHRLMAFHEQKPELLDRSRVTLLNIDHHPSNDHFGNVNIVLPEAPATCFILFLMFSAFGWGITKSMATALLHGLYYDTGSFMHSNTSAETLRVAARLKALGGDHELSVKEQFHTASIEKLRLWGRALSRASLNQKQGVVAVLTAKDYQEENAKQDDISGLVSYLSHAKEGKFCLLLTEDLSGHIKGSFRTQSDDVDLTKIAGLFGGGGHKRAAGFTIPGRLVEKRIWAVQ